MNHSGIGVIVENQDKDFLLHLRDGNTSRLPNQWGLIGGRVENEEDALRAAFREVKEEAGLTLQNPVFIKSFSFNGDPIALIKGDVDTAKEKMLLGEGAELRFFRKDSLAAFIESLPYSNAYLKEMSAYLIGLQ